MIVSNNVNANAVHKKKSNRNHALLFLAPYYPRRVNSVHESFCRTLKYRRTESATKRTSPLRRDEFGSSQHLRSSRNHAVVSTGEVLKHFCARVVPYHPSMCAVLDGVLSDNIIRATGITPATPLHARHEDPWA